MSDLIKESIERLYTKQVIDNRDVRMDEAIQELLLKSQQFDMAVGYFYISGYDLIKEAFRMLMDKPKAKVRILMGNQTNTVTRDLLVSGISPGEAVLQDIRNNAISQREELHELANWMREGRLQVKVYAGEVNYFHAKSYLFHRDNYGLDGFAIVGSSNFSKNGLTGNTELNTMSRDNFIALRSWFDEIWNSDEAKNFAPELVRLIDKVVSPSDIEPYLSARMTYLEFARRYAKPPIKLTGRDYLKSLYIHQKIGVAEVKNRIQQYGTALLCDGVGLGKTRTAAAVIRELGMPQTLIIVSSKLQEQWKEELTVVGALTPKVTFISKEQIARMPAVELRGLGEYEFIVIDEAHQGLKSGSTKVYRNLEYIKKTANHQINGLLLTATPWNNSRRDVFHLGRLFLDPLKVSQSRPYAEYLSFAPLKAAKAFELDEDAFKAFWEDIYLQRTRRTYGGESVTFAKRKFPVVEVIYEPGKQDAFEANYERISQLRLPYMDPLRYFESEKVEFASDRLKLLFFKRADSSWTAFKNTLENIKQKIEKLVSDLTHIQQHEDEVKSRLHRWIAEMYGLNERYDDLFRLLGVNVDEDLTDFEIVSRESKQNYVRRLNERIIAIDKRKAKKLVATLLSDSQADLLVLASIQNDLASAFLRKDEKYEAVREALCHCVSKGEKVLLITQFRDTAIDYFKRFIRDEKLASTRISLVTGVPDDGRINTETAVYTKEEILSRFSPKSKNAPEYLGTEKEIDVVIGTETLSVGQNLQDSRILMNLDLPYNPMVLEQRIGRIDRPRSDGQVHQVDIYTFPSMPVIEAELKMTERLRVKLEGIFSDTRFDDLILPEYEDFLKRVLRERGKSGDAVQEMLDKSVDKQTAPVEAISHSAEYVEAQERLWEMLQSGSQLVIPPNVVDRSASFKTNGHSMAILKTELHDVNGNLIRVIEEPYVLDSEISKDFVKIESQWHEALLGYTRTTEHLPKQTALNAKGNLLKRLGQITAELVESHNQKMEILKDVESKLIDTRAKQVAADIRTEVRGRNKELIANLIKKAGYELKGVRQLANAIEHIDNRDILFSDVLVLHQNIKRLWEDYGYYYDRLVGNGVFEDLDVKQNKNGRVASLENSKTTWEIGHVAVH